MTRVRADDYDDKARSIMDSAAALFAKTGYPNAKMQDIAQACGASKSMLYHYFKSKDELLFAMLKEHLEQVIDGLEEVSEMSLTPKAKFNSFVQLYVQKSTHARRRHVVAMNDVKYLPKARQTPLLALEGEVVRLSSEFLKEINPKLDVLLYKPYTMMLIGMLNWTEIWYRPSGSIKSQELCDRITRLFLAGFMAEK
jgi:AcrR family transcriptional regulator